VERSILSLSDHAEKNVKQVIHKKMHGGDMKLIGGGVCAMQQAHSELMQVME